MKNIYQNLKAVLTTKHEKELIITRPFKKGLGIDVITPKNIDTDVLGTFTGEIPRPGSMQEVLIKKARMGMEYTGLPFAIASEGSFGPHPSIPFAGSDREMIVFIDDVREFSLIEHLLTMKTNFAYVEVKENIYPAEFLQRVGFPENGLIVKPKTAKKSGVLYKGIIDKTHLREAIKNCSQACSEGITHIETDMRAHKNCLRRQVIRELTFKLVRRLRQYCTSCDTPGWGLIGTEKGLPCEACGTSTELVQREIFGCPKCNYQEKNFRSDKLFYAEAKYCPYCNP